MRVEIICPILQYWPHQSIFVITFCRPTRTDFRNKQDKQIPVLVAAPRNVANTLLYIGLATLFNKISSVPCMWTTAKYPSRPIT